MQRNLATLLLASSALTSCATGVTVVKSAHPNPFTGQQTFHLLALDFDHLEVNGVTEAEHTSSMSSAAVDIWTKNKAEFQTAFVLALRESVSQSEIRLEEAGDYAINPYVTEFETLGADGPDRLAITEVLLIVEIRGSNGAVIDQLEARPWLPTGLALEADERVRIAATKLGEWIGDYVVARTQR